MEYRSVRIAVRENAVLERGDLVSDFRMLSLHDGPMGYIGVVKDVCMIDSSLYVLNEAMFSLARFSMADGQLQGSITAHGNGPMEYLQPMSLAADKEQVYLLDMPGMGIIVYDKTLQPQRKVKLTFPCMDVAKVPDGFLCYNLVPTDTLGALVHVGESGAVLGHFWPGDGRPVAVSGAKVFTTDAGGRVCINLPYKQTVYQWDVARQEPAPLLAFDFGKDNLPAGSWEKANVFEEPYAIPAQFFRAGSTSLLSFLCRTSAITPASLRTVTSRRRAWCVRQTAGRSSPNGRPAAGW